MRSLQDSSPPSALGIDAEIDLGTLPPPPLPPIPPPPARGWTANGRSKEHEVDQSALDVECPRPTGPGWFQVWSPSVLREAIVRHNTGCGSSDTQDRSRDAAALRQILKVGPWRQCRVPSDPAATIHRLRESCANMLAVVDLLEERLVLAQRTSEPFVIPPILLLGPPGAGKTHLARTIAAELRLPFTQVDMAGQQTNSFLHGSDRHWGNARPGALFESLMVSEHHVGNPLVLLDEIEKVSTGSRYNPLAALHLALEPSTARQTSDLCIQGIPFDASKVAFIATANHLTGLPDSLLSRFLTFYCPWPDASTALKLAKHLSNQHLQKLELEEFEPFGRAVLVEIASRDRSPRLMLASIEAAISRALVANRQHVVLRDLAVKWPQPH